MKTKVVGVLSLITLLFISVCILQQRELRMAKVRLAQLQREFRDETQARGEQESRARALEHRQSGLSQQVFELSALVANLRASEANKTNDSPRVAKQGDASTGEPDSDEGGLFSGKGVGALFSKMMKDPAMKEMMRSQQKAVMNSMYGPLLKDLNLAPEQKQKFMDLLLAHQVKSMERAETFFKDGKLDVAKIGESEKIEGTSLDSEVKSLLGEEKFAQYEDYKKTMGERMQLEQFKQQLDGTDSALNQDQLKQLTALMKEEKEKNPQTFSGDPTQANLGKFFNPDSLEKQMQAQEEINRRVLERAAQVLTPEQLKSYSEFQSQQLEMQKFGMKMAQQMFGTNANASLRDVTFEIAPVK